MNLYRSNLSMAIFVGADLREANLNHSVCENVVFSGADLRGAYFLEANLRGADFGEANLQDAQMADADLEGASLIAADLRRADLDGANLRDGTCKVPISARYSLMRLFSQVLFPMTRPCGQSGSTGARQGSA